MRVSVLMLSIAGLVIAVSGATHAAVQYPLNLNLDAQIKSGVTTITSKVTIRVDREMLGTYRTRVTDALQHGGYANFLNTLRPTPAVGSISIPQGTVDIHYTREEPDGSGTRLILVADRPLLLLSKDPAKTKAGLELTTVDLRFDGKGGVTGQMAGAARVRPAPDGTVLLDTIEEELVQLKGSVAKP